MPAANDVDMVRVFARESGGPVAKLALPSGTAYEVVLEAEAGDAIHGTGGPYEAGIVVRNLSNSSIVNTQTQSGNFGDAQWPAPPPASNLATQFVFTIPAPPAGLEGDIMEVVAYLSVGGIGPQTPDVSFSTSAPYLIHQP
jgi:hypothetical protein